MAWQWRVVGTKASLNSGSKMKYVFSGKDVCILALKQNIYHAFQDIHDN